MTKNSVKSHTLLSNFQNKLLVDGETHSAVFYTYVLSQSTFFQLLKARIFSELYHKTSFGKEGGVELQNWDITTRGTAKSSKKSN